MSNFTAVYDACVLYPAPLRDLLDLYPVQVCSAAEKVRQRLRNPVMDQEKYLANLLRQSLPQTVSRMKELGYLDGYPFS